MTFFFFFFTVESVQLVASYVHMHSGAVGGQTDNLEYFIQRRGFYMASYITAYMTSGDHYRSKPHGDVQACTL